MCREDLLTFMQETESQLKAVGAYKHVKDFYGGIETNIENLERQANDVTTREDYENLSEEIHTEIMSTFISSKGLTSCFNKKAYLQKELSEGKKVHVRRQKSMIKGIQEQLKVTETDLIERINSFYLHEVCVVNKLSGEPDTNNPTSNTSTVTYTPRPHGQQNVDVIQNHRKPTAGICPPFKQLSSELAVNRQLLQ